MRNLFLSLALLATGVSSAQQFYGSVGASAGNDNMGTFFMAGVNTTEHDKFSIGSEVSLNFMWKNSFIRASFIPQYEVGPVRIGLGASGYFSNKDFNSAKFVLGGTTRFEYLTKENLSYVITSDFTDDKNAVVQFGIKFNL